MTKKEKKKAKAIKRLADLLVRVKAVDSKSLNGLRDEKGKEEEEFKAIGARLPFVLVFKTLMDAFDQTKTQVGDKVVHCTPTTGGRYDDKRTLRFKPKDSLDNRVRKIIHTSENDYGSGLCEATRMFYPPVTGAKA